ncbi:GDP-mannose-dependent alpha-(1-2)-phosphatidylinositol mannosyltransferase [Chlamydia trachomatis]|nr:GDP-mannose-dependent alpha-(1-2)-phosphatidylinositol mannosyltransferase [Chlamydia trachomatis]
MPIGISPQEPNRSLVEQIQAKYRGKRLLLTIGRLVPYKGMKYLVDMASHLGDEYLVLIAGQGPLKQELQQQIVAQGLEGKVKLLGFISDEEKVAYLEACHLFVLSSITKNEAFAIVQLEAMSLQKPVVSTEIADSGVSWVNRDRESGRTVPVKDGKALAEAVEEIFESEESYQGYARRAKARFESLFTIDAMIDRCVEIYKEIQKN